MKIRDETYQMLCGLRGRMGSQTDTKPSFDDVIMFLANRSRKRAYRHVDNGPAFWGFNAPTMVRKR